MMTSILLLVQTAPHKKGTRSSDSKECVFIAVPELDKKLTSKGFSLMSNTPQKLTLSYPGDITLGTLKEFLRCGSSLKHIPTGRKARQKNSKDTIYRRAMCIPKHLFKPHDWEIIISGNNIVQSTLYVVCNW